MTSTTQYPEGTNNRQQQQRQQPPLYTTQPRGDFTPFQPFPPVPYGTPAASIGSSQFLYPSPAPSIQSLPTPAASHGGPPYPPQPYQPSMNEYPYQQQQALPPQQQQQLGYPPPPSHAYPHPTGLVYPSSGILAPPPAGPSLPGKSGARNSPYQPPLPVVEEKLSSLAIAPPAPQPATTTTSSPVDHRKKKRNRPIKSCLPCNQNKRKCDRKRPCGRCTQLGVTGTCVYEVAPSPSSAAAATEEQFTEGDGPPFSTAYSTGNPTADSLRSRIAELEGVIRELKHHRPRTGAVSESGTSIANRGATAAAAKRQRKVKVEHDDDGELAGFASGSGGEDNALDIIRSEEIMMGDIKNSRLFLGGSAGNGLLRKLVDLAPEHIRQDSNSPTSAQEALKSVQNQVLSGVLPSNSQAYPFPTIWSSEIETFKQEVMVWLPTVYQSEEIWDSFTRDVANVFNAWHLPTMAKEYRAFYEESYSGKMETSLPVLSKILAITSLSILLRSTYTSASSPAESTDPTRDRQRSDLFLSAAYNALRLSGFTANPNTDTICSMFLIGLWLMINERISELWSHVGVMIRHSQAIGLHIDPSKLDPKMDVLEQEVRRRMWWSISSLDSIVATTYGRPSGVTFYDTQLPRDISEIKLKELADAGLPLPPYVRSDEITEMTYHAVNWALTVPAEAVLHRIYQSQSNRQYTRNANLGYFTLKAPSSLDFSGTYPSLLKLDDDYVAWYSSLPKKMRFDPSADLSVLIKTTDRLTLMLSFAMCIKAQMMRLALHRPYLMVDPKQYPESSKRSLNAAHFVLKAFSSLHHPEIRDMCALKYFMIWMRAFSAGAVVAFIALREPDSPSAETARSDLRHLVEVFSNSQPVRITNTHERLRNGLIDLENLTILAQRQHQETGAPPPRASPSSQQLSKQQTSIYNKAKRAHPEEVTSQSRANVSAFPAFIQPATPTHYNLNNLSSSHLPPPIPTPMDTTLAYENAYQYDTQMMDSNPGFVSAPMPPMMTNQMPFNPSDDPAELSKFWQELFQLPTE